MNITMKLACCCLAMLSLSATSKRAVAAPPTTGLSTEATLICRQSHPDEAITARLVGSSTTLVCRPVAVSMRSGDGSLKLIGDVTAKPQKGPDFSRALTPQQMQAACEKWLEGLFHIDHTS